ncbi:MAG: GNAT family N-acetyltransferase [Rhabdaerophilum sp.]
MNVRRTSPRDIPGLQKVLEATGLFPAEMLPEMIAGFLSGSVRDEIWLTAEADDLPIGFCYAVPEKLTDGTWNMLAIAVHTEWQGRRIGAAIVAALEMNLHTKGQRVLIAETSSLDEFGQTRDFYRRNGYREEARISDFWAEGNDKIVFWKRL